MRTVADKTQRALASGDLQPLETEQIVIEDQGLPFVVRWIASLASKDAAAGPAEDGADGDAGSNAAEAKEDEPVLPGGPRDPDFNPFLSPEPALTVGPIGAHHTVILNKFPVCLHHLVLARREFAEQLSPLERSDFEVLATILSGEGGLGFFNGGAAAGASQRHKHVQWIPPAQDNATLSNLASALPADAEPDTLARHPLLPLEHCFVRVRAGLDTDIDTSTSDMLRGYKLAMQQLGMATGPDGLLPPHNILVQGDWLLLVPRRQEHYEGVSLNALSFGGTLFVRQRSQMEMLRETGPLHALTEVSLSDSA